MSESVYERWLADYTHRREAVRVEIATIGAKVLEIDSRVGLEGNWPTEEACQYARERRGDLQQKFCLLLWSQGTDDVLFRKLTESETLDTEYARGLLAHKARNFHPRVGRITARLDLSGYYAVMIWPEGRENAPPQPLLLEPPAEMNMWYYVVSVAMELAQAIIVEANYGADLVGELARAGEVGLDGRLLFFDNNNELYRQQDDRRWPLEQIGDAVEFAASQ